jgi:hypothetical protein
MLAKGYVIFGIADANGSALFSREALHGSTLANAT